MKKFVAIILAVLLLASLSVAAYAEGEDLSPEGIAIITDVAASVDADGKEVEVTIEEVSKADEEKVAEIKKEENLKEAMGTDYVEGMQVIDTKVITAEPGVKFPITITLDVLGVTEDTEGSLLVFDGSKWQKAETKFEDGKVTGIFYAVGPIILVVDEDTVNGIVQIYNASDNAAKSPKTADSSVNMNIVMIVTVVCLIGAAAIIVAEKKNKAEHF